MSLVRCLIAWMGLAWAAALPGSLAAQQQAEPPMPPAAMTAEEPSYALLENPTVSEQLGLTPQQRSQVEQLLANRRTALSDAPPDEQDEILADYEEALRSILNERQQGLWRALWASKPPAQPAAVAGGEDQLQFSFRYQPWVDVLNWFAERSKLSLVLDAPPPGTFNYTDNRTYTTAEAIDLLNGVLMTKGYTLVRRERMLLLLNLHDGVPEEMVPRITEEELEKRGQYELVSVLFPLGKREAEDVSAEIKPLLGPYGKSSPLPKTKQILVTETAGKLRLVKGLIESIPEPKKEAPAPRPEPEKPVVAHYPLGNVAPTAAIEVFKAILPDVKVVHEAKSDQLVAWAVPSQQAAIDKTLKEMQAELPADKQRRLEQYPLRGLDSAQLLTLLKPQMTDAQLVIDTLQNKLLAWATGGQHESIQSTLEQLRGTTGGEASGGPRLAVYPVGNLDLSGTLPVIQPLAPAAKIVIDARSRSFVVLATENEHTTIRQALDQLAAAGQGDRAQRLEVYQLAPALRKKAAGLLDALTLDFPGVRKVADPESGDLSVWAKPEQHAMIALLFEQLATASTTGEERRVKAYRVQIAEPTSVISVLQTLLPEAKFVAEAKTRHVVAWAKPAEHEQIAATIAQIDQDLPEDQRMQLMAHPLDKADASTVVVMLRALLPSVQLTSDAKNNVITAWARKGEQTLIEQAIARMQPNLPPEKAPKLVVHACPGVDPVTAVGVLQPLVPLAKLTADRETKSVAVWGTPDDQTAIEQGLAQITARAGGPDGPKLLVYTAGKSDPSNLANSLTPLVPQGRVTADSKSGTIAVWGTPRDHDRVRQALDELQKAEAEGVGRRLVVHACTTLDPPSAASMISSLVPQARLVGDRETKSLAAYGTEEEQQSVAAALTQLAERAAAPDAPRMQVHAAGKANASTLASTLSPLVPNGRITADAQAGTIAVWGTPNDQERIRQALDEMTKAEAEGVGRQLVVHACGVIDPANAASMLATLVPQARLSADRETKSIAAWGTTEEHAAIEQALKQIQDRAESPDAPRVAVYPAGKANVSVLASVLQSLTTQGRVTADVQAGTVTAWATPREHRRMKLAMEEMEKADSAGGRKLVVHPTNSSDPVVVASMLTTLAPQARIVGDRDTKSVAVYGTDDEQQTISAALKQLAERASDPEATQLVVYPAGSANPSTLATMLQTLLPQAKVSADPSTAHVAVNAPPRDQARAKAAIEQMQLGATERETKAYRFKTGDPMAAFAVLRATMPQTPMAVDSRTSSLVATADAADHERIAATVAQLDRPAAEGEAPVLETYGIEGVDPQHAMTVLTTAYATRAEVRFSVDPKSHRLVAWARPGDQTAIRGLIERLNRTGPGDERGSRVYALKSTDPSSALTVLRSLLPGVVMTIDGASGNIVATATPGEDERIRATLAQLEQSADQGQAGQLKVYELRSADPKGAYAALSGMFTGRSGVRISLDTATQRIVAYAPPAQQEIIAETIAQLDGPERDASGERKLEVYPLGEADPQTAVSVLEALRSEMPSARIVQDGKSAQIAALARPGEHAKIRAALDQLQSSTPEVEVFPLATVAPRMAEMAVRRLFESERSGAARPPRVDADTEQQRLFVRGTRPQIEEIRELLVKMGEGGLDASPQAKTSKVRTVALPAGRSKAALAEIQRVWPQLRSNKVRVVTPSAVAPMLREARPAQGAAPRGVLDAEPPPLEQPNDAGGGGDDAGAAPGDLETAQRPAEPAAPSDGEAPPVIVAPGRDSVTISSDDPEALDQFEQLLKTFSGQGTSGGREFNVFTLKNADAKLVAETVSKLYGIEPGRPSFFATISIIADERLNAVIVKASPNDLATIEGLLEVLDTAEVPDYLVMNKPKRLHLRQARAEDVEQILRDLYRAQLASGTTRRTVPVPGGLSREQAAAFEQLASSGPVLSLTVDEGTNSILVVAPPPLLAQIEQLVSQLDEAERTPQQTVKVVKLENVSTEALQKAMQLIMKQPSSSGRRSRSRDASSR